MTHANAPLTPEGRRRLAHLVVEEGWPMRRAAERFQVSPATASRWVGRYRAGQPMEDRSCRPHHSPGRLARRTERRVIALRLNRRWGPHRIAYHLGLARSTVGRILARYNMPRLREVDQATGLAVRRPEPVRYEKTSPGELVHLDIKKLGRIPDGGGWRTTGRGPGKRNRAATPGARRDRHGGAHLGYAYLHTALDDHSRLAYTEILADERKETAVAFFQRAHAHFTSCGITIRRVLTDNGGCYKSFAWRDALTAAGITHKRTRPYRPQTNGKVERFHRTLADEWAYARPYHSETERRAALAPWLHMYNHHRSHTALGGLPPASRVTNLSGDYT